MKDWTKKQEWITRFEVIDESWRKYRRESVDVVISVQDDWRTMKVFINSREKALETKQ